MLNAYPNNQPISSSAEDRAADRNEPAGKVFQDTTTHLGGVVGIFQMPLRGPARHEPREGQGPWASQMHANQ